MLDIGCGGGLVCEPLTRLGASVTGIDPALRPSKRRRPMLGRKLDIDYQATTAEELSAKGKSYDVVLLLEVVEHVPDVPAFLKAVAPSGQARRPHDSLDAEPHLKAYALAIVGAEYILRWLPIGTHQWERFVRPEELAIALSAAGLKLTDKTGMVYNPLADEWRLGPDTDVNYFATAIQRG